MTGVAGISGGFSGFPDMYEIKTLWINFPIMVHMYYTPPKCGLKGNYSKVFYCQSKAIRYREQYLLDKTVFHIFSIFSVKLT